MMILVTGGTGFLGRHLVSALCRSQYTVRLLARDPSAHAWLTTYPRVEAVAGDIRDADAVRRAVDGCTHVIHAAGRFRFWGDAETFNAINTLGTQHVVAAALEAQVERFIHVSTIALIGQPERVVDETHPAQPADAYQQSKYAGEQLALRYHAEHGLPVVVLRPGAFYGPLGQYAFNRLFFKDPLRGIIMQVNRGRYITFPVYIADVAQGIIKALEQGRPGEIYNICGDSLTHKEAFDIICAEGDIRWPRVKIPGWLGIEVARMLTSLARITRREPFWPLTLQSYVYNYWQVSNEKARRELGFAPIDFREGARRTLAWYRSGQPDHIPEVDC
ncbi:MAG: NAD-dependent epimerase/dehydratase family protein [Chloroflexi bacterium]|nr:NAD-dependent epimerase/dehydratase family protein [Chloroflexota bacterium]